MAIKDVLTWPHEGLRVVAEKVEDASPQESKDLYQDLKDTMLSYNAEGLAATQIGSSQRVICVKDENGQPTILVNPRITMKGDRSVDSDEGCLSFPGVNARVKRAAAIDVTALNEHGEEVTVELAGMPAVAVQHEIDHLDGVVMLDYLGPTARRLALKRLKKVGKRVARFKELQKGVLRHSMQLAQRELEEKELTERLRGHVESLEKTA